MDEIRRKLYWQVDPDSLTEVCSYIHPRFHDFLFGNWDTLSKEDSVWMINEYHHINLLRHLWKQLTLTEKRTEGCKLLIKAIENKKISLAQTLVQLGVDPYSQHVHLARRQGLLNLAHYLTYHKRLDLSKKTRTSADSYNKWRIRSNVSRCFRRKR